ncbi:MAG: ribonuclease HII [Alphaproteobacteria bacterium]
MPHLEIEISFGAPAMRVCGVDEVGRGPLAGPVVAAAVVLDVSRMPAGLAAEIDDSKTLARAKREEISALVTAAGCAWAHWAIGSADVEEIDRLNILQASLLAMRRAVAGLVRPPDHALPDHALVDGNRCPDFGFPATAVIGGDGLSLSIACASIVAKVYRDRMLAALAADHPVYGWDHNAGYGTPEHLAALRRHGVTPHHRRSFSPVAACC